MRSEANRRVLTEASGGLTASYLLEAISDAGAQPIASDILDESFIGALGFEYCQVPSAGDPDLWSKISTLVGAKNIQVVIPTLDETLLGWSQRKDHFRQMECDVIISDPPALEVCQDKWKTYQFFIEAGVPTPKTSLAQDYSLVKPREGRGGSGIQKTEEKVEMTGMISQELAQGSEYTVDVFFDRENKPIYIVPRLRVDVRDGKSTKGRVEECEIINHYIRKISSKLEFVGATNFQCFVDGDDIKFIEINPRFGGGTALAMAATENWIGLIIKNLLLGDAVTPKPIKYGMRMIRYYKEYFVFD